MADAEGQQSRADGRIHGLDALRGVLMLLGIVLHTLIGYLPEGPWAREGATAMPDVWRFIFDAIHLFRMPAFFVLAGYFGALLWTRRGARAMLRNRLQRVGLPMGLFILILWPAVHFAVGFRAGVIEEHASPLIHGYAAVTKWGWVPQDTLHLWFLYMLLGTTLIGVGLATLSARYNIHSPRLLTWAKQSAEGPWKSLIVFGLLNTVWFAPLSWASLPSDGSWLPSPLIFIYYLGCYGLGWLFFAGKLTLNRLSERAWTLLIVGLLCVAIRAVSGPIDVKHASDFPTWSAHILLCLVSSIGLVAFTRGFAGLFLRYASSGTKGWRYLSDASYWVYLLHLPLAIMIPALIIDWDIPGDAQCLLSMVLVATLCVVTYDLAVRATSIGLLLNGRRYSRYSLRLSSLMGALTLGWLAQGLVMAAPPPTPRPPWLDGQSAQTLLPQEEVMHRTLESFTPVNGMNLTRCVDIRSYTFCPQRMTHSEAERACDALSSQLVMLEGVHEAEAVGRLASTLSRSPFWLGLTDKQAEGEWIWASNRALSHTGWASGEPNDWGGNEDCAVCNYKQNGEWNDAPCDSKYAFICERPAALSPR